jgi:ectoine hydroxylase-related dioxygenase (phytanoyl-CoA dioxygenase family)
LSPYRTGDDDVTIEAGGKREAAMATSLSGAQVEGYWRDGYLAPLDILTREEAARYRAALEAAEARAGEGYAKELRHKPHLLCRWADELVRHPKILDAVEGVIGPDILCWESVLFTKPARSSDFISWHQDITYWGLEAEGNVVTCWVALSPSTAQSGCMRVVPGTHRREVVPHRDTFAPGNLLSRGQEIAVEVRDEEAVDVVLQPGQASLHHVKIFHGSFANHSDDRRIGFAIRYIPPGVRQQVGGADSATLVRGRDTHGYFELERPPEEDFAPDAMAAHARLRAQRMAILMRPTM